ncbi:MAG: class I SAM-dependent methyltransferase [Patescibacteria group bacterium]
MKLRIPQKHNLIPLKYGYIDSTIDQYYRPIQGYFMRKRLELALSVLDDRKFDRVLDVGYGGGTFIPNLVRLAKKVYGIDTLPKKQLQIVEKILKKEGIAAELIVGSIFKTPYKSNFFDAIFCISVLEHFRGEEINRAIREMYRILKPQGFLVIGSPVKNPMTDFIIDHFLSFDPNDIHPSGHKQILKGIKDEVSIDKRIHYFPFLPLDLSLYFVVRIKKTK